MTMFRDTSAIMDDRLKSFLLTLSEPPEVQWENREFTRTLDTLHLRATLVPGTTRTSAIGAVGVGTDETELLYYVDVLSKAGSGKFDNIEMADLVADHFKRGTELSFSDTDVTIRSTSRRGGRLDGGWYISTVIVAAYAVSERR